MQYNSVLAIGVALLVVASAVLGVVAIGSYARHHPSAR